jgi:phosphoglycolate phosphatase
MLRQNVGYDQLLSRLVTKKHVIWDWNGTLLNDVDHAVETMNHLLQKHSLPSLDRHRYQKIFDFPVKNYYDALGFDYSKESFEDLCHLFVDRFMAGFHMLPLVDQMERVLRELHRNEVQQSVLSATDQLNLDNMISHFGLNGLFAHVFGIDNKLAGSKIARGHELLKISEVSPTDSIIVGDTIHDLEVADALGIEAVLVSHGHQCAERLRAHGANVIEI